MQQQPARACCFRDAILSRLELWVPGKADVLSFCFSVCVGVPAWTCHVLHALHTNPPGYRSALPGLPSWASVFSREETLFSVQASSATSPWLRNTPLAHHTHSMGPASRSLTPFQQLLWTAALSAVSMPLLALSKPFPHLKAPGSLRASWCVRHGSPLTVIL